MENQDAVDLARHAIWMTVLIGSPVLAVALAVGLVVGVLQAITQVQEQTVSFVPKLIAIAAVLFFALPWLVSQAVEYSRDVITNIPSTLGR